MRMREHDRRSICSISAKYHAFEQSQIHIKINTFFVMQNDAELPCTHDLSELVQVTENDDSF